MVVAGVGVTHPSASSLFALTGQTWLLLVDGFGDYTPGKTLL